MRFSSIHRLFSRFGLRAGLGLGLLLGSAGLVLATTLSLFTARHTGTMVQVEWEVSTETDLMAFRLSRKLPNETDYTPLTTLAPTGRLHYAYADTCLAQGRSGLLAGPVVYRLMLCGPGLDQAYTTTIPGTTGSMQRSWGTVKAMFR